jgi:hypothetical protein
VFVYRYVFTGLIAPIGLLILKYLQCHCYTTLIDGKTVSSQQDQEFYQYWYRLITNMCPPLLKLVIPNELENTADPQSSNPKPQQQKQQEQETLLDFAINSTSSTINNKYVRQILLIPLMTDSILLLSFGVMFPPLGWLIILSMLKDWLLLQVLISRILHWYQQSAQQSANQELSLIETKQLRAVTTLLRTIDSSLSDLESKMIYGWTRSVVLCSALLSFGLFDTIDWRSSRSFACNVDCDRYVTVSCSVVIGNKLWKKIIGLDPFEK